MSIKADVHREVMQRLEQNPTLSAYIRNVFDNNFNMDRIVSGEMPCITVHPLGADEEYADFPKRKQDFYVLEIRGILSIQDRKPYNKNVMFEDTAANYVGLYKLERDIKNAIENLPDGSADDLSFANTGHYPKLKTVRYENIGQNVSAHVVIELEIDSRYFFVGQR